MKRTTALLAAILGLTIVLQAQQTQSKIFSELSLGPSIPVGRFAATSANSSKRVAGFAKPGVSAQLSAGYYLKNSYGLLVSAGFATLPQNKQGRIENLARIGVKVNQMDCKNWKEIKLMAGGFYTSSIVPKLMVIAKLTAGVLKTKYPKISGSGVDTLYMAPAVISNLNESLPLAFCYQASAGLQYTLNQKWYALIEAGYFNATASKAYTYTTYSLPPNSTVPVSTTVSGRSRYAFEAINTMVGVGVNF